MGCNCKERREMGRRIVTAMRQKNYIEAKNATIEMSRSAAQDIRTTFVSVRQRPTLPSR